VSVSEQKARLDSPLVFASPSWGDVLLFCERQRKKSKTAKTWANQPPLRLQKLFVWWWLGVRRLGVWRGVGSGVDLMNFCKVKANPCKVKANPCKVKANLLQSKS